MRYSHVLAADCFHNKCQLKWRNLASEAHGELLDKPYRLTSYRPRSGPRINASFSATIFDMQPFCPNLTCESGVPVWIKTHCAWDSGRSSLEKRSSHGDLLKWFGQVWSISKSQRSMGTVSGQPNMFSSLGTGVPLERGFWKWVFFTSTNRKR